MGNYVAYGLAVKYDTPNLFTNLHTDNCEYVGFSIEQMFLFSRYASDPPHEPSGTLSAARLHPRVSYELSPNTNFDRSKAFSLIRSIRFDFRLNLDLDTFLKDKTESGLFNDNQAGLFADSDTGSVRAFLRRFRSTSRVAFYAVEKPVICEVVAPGLVSGESKGRMPGSSEDIVCWDNIHWWGADAPGRPMISTPGAFHAAHIHWRWGEILKSWLARAGSAQWRRFVGSLSKVPSLSIAILNAVKLVCQTHLVNYTNNYSLTLLDFFISFDI